MQRLCALSLCLMIVVQGCYMGQSTVVIPEGVSLGGYEAIELAINNDTGQTFEFDISAYLTEQLTAALRKEGQRVQEPVSAGERALVLQVSIVAYQPGSAGQRWLGAFGSGGKTQATVRTFLFDKTIQASLGEILTFKWISEGGLYTIGAEKIIWQVVANDIVEQLQQRMRMR